MLTTNPIPTTLRARTKAPIPPSETQEDASTSPFTFDRRVGRDVSYARPTTTTTTTGGAAADADARLQDLDVYFWGRNGVGDCVDDDDDDDDDDDNNNNNYGTVGTMAGVTLVGAEAEAEAEAKAKAKAEREGLWVMYVSFKKLL